jgi:predicted Zn-dependent peptidase
VFGWNDGRVGPGLFRLIVASNVGVDINECEALMYEEIDRVKTEGISEEELEKLKVNFKTSFISGRQTVINKAEALHHYVFFHDDIADINRDVDLYMAVTAEDIQRVANKYLVENNRTAVTAMPPSS